MNTVTLLPAAVRAINEEMAAYQQRELRLLLEISNLHKALDYVAERCKETIAYTNRANTADDLTRGLALSNCVIGLKAALDRARAILPEGFEP